MSPLKPGTPKLLTVSITNHNGSVNTLQDNDMTTYMSFILLGSWASSTVSQLSLNDNQCTSQTAGQPVAGPNREQMRQLYEPVQTRFRTVSGLLFHIRSTTSWCIFHGGLNLLLCTGFMWRTRDSGHCFLILYFCIYEGCCKQHLLTSVYDLHLLCFKFDP